MVPSQEAKLVIIEGSLFYLQYNNYVLGVLIRIALVRQF